MSSRMETALRQATPMYASLEHELELVHKILAREVGTPDQRNAILRIIAAHKVRRPTLPRLVEKLHLNSGPGRGSYSAL